ncbi:MAG TPA: MMPL family transporter [Solirubrobacteraceae bacterium]|nr:MMPL family transporter [Solirubrobacteraceae bacterium]
MFRRITTITTRFPKSVIAFWLVAALALSSLASGVGYKVMTDDTSEFLPKGSESARAIAYARDAFGVQKGTRTVTMLVKRDDGDTLTAADRAEVGALATALARWPSTGERDGRVVAAQAGPVARHGQFQLVALQWQANATDPVAQDHFRDIRDRAADQARAHHLSVGFTGGIASQADEVAATEDTTATAQSLLFIAVILLSLLFFRGPLAAIVPLASILLVASAASSLVVLAAHALGFKLDTSTPQLITVVLVGIGVDYFLFLLFRLRERLRGGEDRRTAARNAAGAVGPVIASAALAVVAAFATMVLADFGQFRMLGPAIAISVLVMLLAGVTLMPAIAAVTGRALFWPSRSWARERTDGPAARLGRRIARRPARAALAVTAVLIVLATFAAGTTMSYDLGGGPSTPATRTADQITAALSDGATDPQHVYVKSSTALTTAELNPLRARLAAVHGVTAVGRPLMAPDAHGARIDVVLADAPISATAMDIASGPLRDAAHRAAPAGATTMVAGTSATFADVSHAIDRDMHVILPVAALLILLILVLTLRSVVAPLYLLAAVALEFGATLGAATLVFQVLGDASGIGFILPLVLFLFVVALGTDYNILVSARLREEMLAGAPVGEAVARAVRNVAPAVGAAGLVLATSFGTLMLEADEATRQQGFAMAFGILVASLLVATILVPALTALVGRRAWRRPAV